MSNGRIFLRKPREDGGGVNSGARSMEICLPLMPWYVLLGKSYLQKAKELLSLLISQRCLHSRFLGLVCVHSKVVLLSFWLLRVFEQAH